MCRDIQIVYTHSHQYKRDIPILCTLEIAPHTPDLQDRKTSPLHTNMSGTCGNVSLDWVSHMHGYLMTLPPNKAIPPAFTYAYKLMHHPRLHHIRSSRGFIVEHDGMRKRMDGLTSQLKDVFHPMSMSVSTGGMRTGGSTRGCVVDKEIEDLVNNGKIPDSGTLHIYTVKTLEHLQKHGLRPFACQIPVYDGALGIATTLDILCIDTRMSEQEYRRKSNVVNIQLKTGFENNNYKKGQGYMTSPAVKSSPLSRLEDSYYARHQLQLLVEHMILRVRYDQLVGQSRVLVISGDRHSSYPLDTGILALYNDVYRNLHLRKEIPPWETIVTASNKQTEYGEKTKAKGKKRASAASLAQASKNQHLHKKAKQMFT